MQSILGQPCDICGDIGIAQAIVTCSNCHKSREHIYCMHPNLCSVPKSWFCNPCQYHVNHHDNCHSECSTHRGQELEDLSIRENACAMANESFKGDIRTLKGSFSSDFLPTPDITSVGNDHVYQSSDHPECLTVGRVQASAPEKQNHEISQPLHGCESSLNFPGKMGPLLSEDCICKEKPGEADLRCQEDDTLNSKGSLKFVEEDLPNPPAVNSLWKGSFAVLDFYDELYEGVEAYPPRKLSRKAYLVSKEMPSTLQFKLMPRLHVWPKTFHRVSPSGFDISLYFRADDRCRENYNHLMQWMVEKDLSMVSRLNGMKLLIFTSSQLPVESQRLNKQIFLWGVFILWKVGIPMLILEGNRRSILLYCVLELVKIQRLQMKTMIKWLIWKLTWWRRKKLGVQTYVREATPRLFIGRILISILRMHSRKCTLTDQGI